jgi:hypothetical protein
VDTGTSCKIATATDKICGNESKNHMRIKISHLGQFLDKMGLFLFLGTPCKGKIGKWNTFCFVNFAKKLKFSLEVTHIEVNMHPHHIPPYVTSSQIYVSHSPHLQT